MSRAWGTAAWGFESQGLQCRPITARDLLSNGAREPTLSPGSSYSGVSATLAWSMHDSPWRTRRTWFCMRRTCRQGGEGSRVGEQKGRWGLWGAGLEGERAVAPLRPAGARHGRMVPPARPNRRGASLVKGQAAGGRRSPHQGTGWWGRSASLRRCLRQRSAAGSAGTAGAWPGAWAPAACEEACRQLPPLQMSSLKGWLHRGHGRPSGGGFAREPSK